MDIAKECITAVEELIEKAHLKKGDIVVVGCSTSEVLGSKIGTNSSPDTAKILFESIYNVLKEKGIYRMDIKIKKEVIITDVKGTVHRYTDAKVVIDSTYNVIKVTFKYDTDVVYFPIVNILNIRVKEY